MKKRTLGFLSLLVGGAFGAIAAAVGVDRTGKKKLMVEKQFSTKHLELYLMMDRWVEVKQKGKNLADYLKQEGYQTIAIYGMSYAGNRLVKELEGTGIEIKYGIDKKADNIHSKIKIYTPKDIMEDVDAVVVTSISFFDEIAEKLEEQFICPIISLDDIINAVLYEA